MARVIPSTPNVNTRRPMMSPLALNQIIQHIKGDDLDSWGAETADSKPVEYECKIQYSSQRFFLRTHAGHEKEDTAYIFLRGKVKVSTTDILRYQFPDGDMKDFKPVAVSHIFDMSGNVFLTKVWAK